MSKGNRGNHCENNDHYCKKNRTTIMIIVRNFVWALHMLAYGTRAKNIVNSKFMPLNYLLFHLLVVCAANPERTPDLKIFFNLVTRLKRLSCPVQVCAHSTLPVYTESKGSDKNFTSSETVFSRVDHYVGHSWWSLVTSDVVTSDQWPSGVTHIVINPRKTVLLRVRFFHSVWLSVDRQWTFFNEFLNYFAMVRASWTAL